MAEVAGATTHGSPLVREFVIEDDSLARHQPREAGTQPKQRRLTRAVGPHQQDDLPSVDIEIHAGKRRKAAKHRHRVPEGDHRRVGHCGTE